MPGSPCSRAFLVFALAAVFAPAFPAFSAAPVADGVTASLKVLSPRYEGVCPTTVRFVGAITVTDPTVTSVRYQFTRSDDMGSPVATLAFDGPGTREISTEIRVDGDFTGWMGVRILRPGENRIIGKAHFEVRCADREASWSPTFSAGEDIRITEDCVSFNRADLAVTERGGRWKIAEGERDLFDFATRDEAERALEVIRAYRGTHACASGEGFRYFLAGGRAPAGPPPGGKQGEDLLSFDPDKIKVKKLPAGWSIVEGDRSLFSFGANDSDARQALAVIRRYRFDRACRLEGSQGPYWYLRK